MKIFFIFIFLISCGLINIAAQSVSDQEILQRNIEPLYRKATKKELGAVVPKPDLYTKYAEFLRGRDNAGLTKLINDKGCADNIKVFVVTDECLKYTMPGGGSSYSFRVRNYRIPRLSDVLFTENSFQAAGVLLHGIFVNIGDVALENVTLTTGGMNFLVNFKPEVDYEKAKKIDRNLIEGIRDGKFLYRRGLYAVENTTFVLRSIAYDGKYFRAAQGVTYNEFDFDKRRDIIVAFRIVDKDEAGNVTILWKILSETKSPRVKRPESEKVELN